MRGSFALFGFFVCVAIFAIVSASCDEESTSTLAQNSLDTKIEQAMTLWRVPGLAVVVIKDGETALMKGFGTRKVGTDLPVTEKTYLQIASNSKTFCAYLFGMLVDDGKLKWDDPIKKHIPVFELSDPYVTENIAVDDLLCHRSGLSGNPGGFRDPNYTFESLLKDLKTKKISIRFRSKNNYTNAGMAILGEVVNRVTDESWGENIRKRIFVPLGMGNSYTSNMDFENRVGALGKIGNIMYPAIKKDGVVSVGSWENVGTADLYAPAGGIISTMEDMAKWIAFRVANGAHKGVQLISLDSIDEIRQIRIPTSFANMGLSNAIIYPRESLMGTGYGQYTFEHYGNKVVVHNGGWMNSVIEVVPKKNLGVGVFSNATFSDVHAFEAMAFVNAVALIVIDHFLGFDDVDWSNEMMEILRGDRETS